MAIIFRDSTFDDRSKSDCSTRIVFCEGVATASDPARLVAASEARDEARAQLDAAIAASEAAVDCPAAGCSAPARCVRTTGWRVGRTAGSVAEGMGRDWAGNWIVRRRAFVERVLGCACIDPGAISDKGKGYSYDDAAEPAHDHFALDDLI